MVMSKEDLYGQREQRTYNAKATEAAFLLGGIGAGNMSLGARGELRDWEIFNKPGKGISLPNTYFSIWAKEEGKEAVAKVLESQLQPPHSASHGYHPLSGGGLPRMKSSTLRGEYPIAWVDFEEEKLPVQVQLEAYTPLIPLNVDDSSLPGAIFTYNVSNTSTKAVDVSIVGSMINPIGGVDYDSFGNLKLTNMEQNLNQFKEKEGYSGLFFSSNQFDDTDLHYGNLALATTNKQVTYKRAWLRGEWFDFLQEFWDDFKEDGRLEDLGYESATNKKKTDTGSIGAYERIEPGQSKQFQFILSWYFPNRINGWNNDVRVKESGREVIQNYYANQFSSSWDVVDYMIKHQERLEKETRQFHSALFESTLPHYVLDALAGNLPALRSTLCFRLADGRFLGYEGCFDDGGCCDGTCTHVWNYAQTLAFLFPSLEQNMRQTEFLEETNEQGKMNFRAFTMFDSTWMWRGEVAPAAVDGQMGTIMRVYREWQLTGDEPFLRKLWPSVQRTLNYAILQWDTDDDLVLDGKQHNTYDIEFYGPNPLTAIFFLGALRAAEEMARHLGERELAQKYQQIFEISSKKTDELLWNGDYYVQRLEDVNQYKYQHGIGCLSDQLLGQQLAHVYGLGYLLPQERVKQAIHSVFQHNFKQDFTDHVNCQRTYVLNDEQGLLLCSWPNGERPRLPFVYSDEVWTGIEYHVATHLIFEGFIEEGLTMVKAVRNRQDGIKRNPWNEVECGHHYARSMSSWGLLIALSGFSFDMAKKEISFQPAIHKQNFSSFWSTGLAWGIYTQQLNPETDKLEPQVTVLYGDASGMKVSACGQEWVLD